MEERRRLVRREADDQLLRKLGELQAAVEHGGRSADKEAGHRRRRAIRHNCKVTIRMVVAYASGTSDDWSRSALRINGRVLDLSVGGASLFTKDPFETNQQIELLISLQGGASINAQGAVKWIKAMPEKHGCASGIQFTTVSSKDQRKITKFLKKLDASAGL